MIDDTSVSNENLLHFCRQLHSWSKERLNLRPGPFRQAELCRRFIGVEASASPLLVFWVNRESFFAGGIVLFPEKADEGIHPTAREAARVLGLPHYFTWGRHEICCWSAEDTSPRMSWNRSLPQHDIASPEAFRESFKLLFDQLERLFFEHQKTIPIISDLYLANLVHSTFLDLSPRLRQASKIRQNPDERVGPPSETLERRFGAYLLLPLMLALDDSLPRILSPESISATLSAAIDALPDQAKPVWNRYIRSFHLPDECRRRVHLYLSRIQQLRDHLPGNLISAMHRLVDEWSSQFGGHPLPAATSDLKRCVINPDRIDERIAPDIEIAAEAILAATNIARRGRENSATGVPLQLSSPLELKTRLQHFHVVGTLGEKRVPTAIERRSLNALLRISWPNHKLSLPAKTPVWVWELVHLCGLADRTCRLDLVLPGEWLWERYGSDIVNILDGKVYFRQVAQCGDDRLHLRLDSLTGDNDITTVRTVNGSLRALKPVAPNLRSQINAALTVPDEVFKLIESGELKFLDQEQIEELSLDGLSRFLRSTLGSDFWQLLAPGSPHPKMDQLAVACARAGMPLPGAGTLSALARIRGEEGQVSTAEINQELLVWLGKTRSFGSRTPPRRKKRNSSSLENRIRDFRLRCEKEEIPVFPDNYIYQVPEAERISFTLNGPLTVIDAFFDQVVLQDNEHNNVTVRGIRQGDALALLSSFRFGPVELPRREAQTADILDRYLDDVKSLRERYYRLAVMLLPETDADEQINEVWRNAPLPDWNLVKDR